MKDVFDGAVGVRLLQFGVRLICLYRGLVFGVGMGVQAQN